MIMMAGTKALVLALALFCLTDGAPRNSDPPLPVFKPPYSVTGTIKLPYAEIEETFTAYDDSTNNRSRVDYYNGIQQTIQKSFAQGFPFGVTYLIVPFTNQSVTNLNRCFQTPGAQGATVGLTTVMPDLKDFKFIGKKQCRGDRMCNAFQEVVTVGSKTSTYTFYATQAGNVPVRYEMMGYDSLLGSHFDKYYVDYDTYIPDAKFQDSDFEPPKSMKCGSFPGPGSSKEHKNKLSPIREFVHREDDHVSEAFENFKKQHNKVYSDREHNERHGIFRQNLRYINSKNRAGNTYTMAVNHLADLSPKEMKRMRGFRYTHENRGGKTFDWKDMKTVDPPAQWDWRLEGAVTPVKDQAICGSCWSFGTTGTIEGANFLKTGKLVRLSQSELVDCSWGYGNNGCDGGEDFRAYKYMIENGGLTSEDQYGPYLGIDYFCSKSSVTPVVQITNYTTVTQGDLNALKVALFNKGPISVAIDASHKSFGFYSHGVYYEKDCKSGPDDLDHAVLAVGYGVMDGQAYWLVKNSWSTYWGNDGYVLMSQKDNNCGVATDATFVDIKA